MEDFFRNEFKEHFICATYIREFKRYEWSFKNVDFIDFTKFKSKYINRFKIEVKSRYNRIDIDLIYFTEIDELKKIKEELISFLKEQMAIDLYRVEIKTAKQGTLYIFLDKTLEEVEALKLGFKNETDLKLLISKQKR